MKKRLLWQIYPAFLLITLIGLVAISWNVSILLREFYKDEKTAQLERLARVATHYFEDVLGTEQYDKMQAVCVELGRTTKFRFTLIDLEGKVLADSNENPRQMENHLMRPEVQAVVGGQIGSDIRTSRTIGQEMLYVGLPLKADERTVALRIAVHWPNCIVRPARQQRDYSIRGCHCDLLAAASLALSWKISRRWRFRLRAAFAAGDLNHRLPVPPSARSGRWPSR